jgi:hypothetical protein
MAEHDACPERLTLAKAVSDAIAATYKINEQRKTATIRTGLVFEGVKVALATAREAERHAVRALDQHTQIHGCKL